MSPIDAGIMIVLLALPFHWAVLRQFDKMDDPGYLRRHGVVIVSEKALEGHAESIGLYCGHEVWASVTFKGMTYRFDHVAAAREREQLHEHELYLPPGLVYVTD